MRHLAFVLVLTACLDTDVPWRKVGSKKLTAEWTDLGLPTAGGEVRRSDAGGLIVAFRSGTAVDDRRRGAAFEAALRGNGWTPQDEYGDLTGGQVRRIQYRVPTGETAMLALERRGDQFRVTVTR